jgi:hypothetical protein
MRAVAGAIVMLTGAQIFNSGNYHGFDGGAVVGLVVFGVGIAMTIVGWIQAKPPTENL